MYYIREKKMIRKYLIFFIPIVLATAFFLGCKKQELVSVVPSIKYVGFSKVQYPNSSSDSVIFVQFNFQDGDGDIGLDLGDTTSPFRIGELYYYNVIGEYLQFTNGIYNHLIMGGDTINFNDRIADIQPDSRNKGINGTITLKITPISGGVLPDSIKLNICLIDRALHRSNVITTGGIKVRF